MDNIYVTQLSLTLKQ